MALADFVVVELLETISSGPTVSSSIFNVLALANTFHGGDLAPREARRSDALFDQHTFVVLAELEVLESFKRFENNRMDSRCSHDQRSRAILCSSSSKNRTLEVPSSSVVLHWAPVRHSSAP